LHLAALNLSNQILDQCDNLSCCNSVVFVIVLFYVMLFLYSNKEEQLLPIIVSLNNKLVRVRKRQYACARWSPVQKQNEDYTNSTTP